MRNPSSYIDIVAGAVPVNGEALPEDTVLLAAQEALGTSRVHYMVASVPNNGRYLYFAVPSAVLASEADTLSPLAAALPGHPDHHGDGIYVLNVQPYKVAAIVYDDNLTVLCNEGAMVDAFVADYAGLAIHVVDHADPMLFSSGHSRLRMQADSLNRAASLGAVWIAGVAGVVMLASATAQGVMSVGKRQHQDVSSMVKEVSSKLATSSPLQDKLNTLQAKSATVVRAGGWIDFYRIKDGKEDFRFYMPSWTTRDYIDGLGPDVRGELTAVSPSLMQLVRGTPPNEDIKRAEAAAAGEQGGDQPQPPAQGAQPAAQRPQSAKGAMR